MKTPESIAQAARARIAQARDQINYSRTAIADGMPLAAETERPRAVQRVQKVTGVDPATAEQIVDYKDPASLGLRGPELRKAEALQGKTVDYIGVAWLEAGRLAANTVARITLRSGDAWGSGFLVSDRLLLTNNHVIERAADSGRYIVEFRYEVPLEGGEPRSVRYELDPNTFFETDETDDLDFTLIALGRCLDGSIDPREFGSCSLTESSLKHSVGEPVNIIQHPDGDYKQVVVRENRILHRGDNVLHYVADTEPGASGSPVFNDEWQVVALHHWGEPHREVSSGGRTLNTDVNEGIRVSAIVEELKLRRPSMNANRQTLLDQALRGAQRPPLVSRTIHGWQGGPHRIYRDTPVVVIPPSSNAIAVLPPRTPTVTAILDGSDESSNGTSVPRVGPEKATIDTDYSNRRGYDERFLKGLNIPLPQLNSTQRKVAARVRGTGEATNPYELKYQHFSVVVNASRRMAFYSACNIDGAKHISVNRKTGQAVSGPEATEVWAVDPRIPPEAQLDDAFYKRLNKTLRIPEEFFARGHMTRREDPNWGNADRAERANADTFHHPNGCPQAQNTFNGSQNVWQGLENYILNSADDSNLRVTVITGPVFEDGDPVYLDDKFGEVQIPRRYWKIVARVEDDVPKVFAVLADQSEIVDKMFTAAGRREALWDWPSKLSKEYKATVAHVADLTGLDFGDLVDHDIFADTGGGGPGGGLESLPASEIEVRSIKDLIPLASSRGMGFGKFESMGDFLDAWEEHTDVESLVGAGVDTEDGGGERKGKKKKPAKRPGGRPTPPSPKHRLVVDVEALVHEVFADDLSGSKHQQFAVKLTSVTNADAGAQSEVQDAIRLGTRVRVALRFGDSRGIPDRVPGIRTGAKLHLKGEWIPAKQAYDVGGEDIPVLHFTHDPLGFICTEARCFQ